MFKQTVATLALFAALTTTASAQRRIDDPPAPQADLTGSQGWIDVAAMRVRFTITNNGSAVAQSCKTRIDIAAGSPLASGELSSAVLAPGQSADLWYPLGTKALLAHLSGKTVIVSIQVDYYDAVDEHFEGNNNLKLVW